MPLTRSQLAILAAVTLLLLTPVAATFLPGRVRANSGAAGRGHWSDAPVAALRSAGILPAERFAPDSRIDAAAWQSWLCRAAVWPAAPDCPAAPFPGAANLRHLTRSAAVQIALPHAPNTLIPGAALPPALRERPDAGELDRALKAGLLTGDAAGTLAPDRLLTRAEAAVVAGRVVINRKVAVPWQLEPERQTPLDKVRLLLHPELSGPHRYLSVTMAAGRVVAAPVRVAETPLTLRVGAESGLGAGLLLVGTSGIHTRWGPVPLDLAFLTEDGTILALYPQLPRDVVRRQLWASLALELPGGTLAAAGLSEGDRLRITDLASGNPYPWRR